MTSTEIREMISWLREQGAVQVQVESVSATFLQPQALPFGVDVSQKEPIEVIRDPFEDHVRTRFGVSASELLGG